MIEFDPNRPPPMPVSALLYSSTWMRLVYYQAPWLIYPLMRNARRDASAVTHWLRFYIWIYTATLRWAELNAAPVVIRIRL